MHVKLKKRYGQNFLIDKNILIKISFLIKKKNLSILEIGPGSGNLTEHIISKRPKSLKIVEIDSDLIYDLNLKFSKYKFLEIINKDILNEKISENFDLVISNLPYNISSQILVKFSISKKRPPELIFMFQKEFAERLLDSKINSINSLVKCFYEIELKFHVSKNCFRPSPKVNSSVLYFKKKKELIKQNEIDNFIQFKQKLFSHKRKSLQNLLKNYNIENKINLNRRIEELELDELIFIFRIVNS